MPNIVFVNGAAKPFVLVDGTKVRRKPLPQIAPATRTEGRSDITSIQNRLEYKFGQPIRGMGKTRIVDANDPKEFEYLADSTALTRHKTGIYAATLSNTATAPSNPANVTLGACKALLVQGTTIYGYWSGVYNDGAGDTRGRVYSAFYSAGSWNNNVTQVFTSAADAGANTAIIVYAAVVAGGNRLTMFSAYDTTGGTWDTYVRNQAGGALIQNTSTGTSSWDANVNGGEMLADGATVWAAMKDSPNGTIDIYKSTNTGASFASYGTIPSSDGPTGLALYEDDTGTRSLMVGTAEGVWAVNTTSFAAAIVRGLDMRQSVNTANCRGMIEKQGSLYVPRGDGYGSYVKATWNGDSLTIAEVGPATLGGLPTARQGAVTAVCEAGRHAFWAAGGLAASKNASVWCWDPVYDALHSEWQNGTANRRIDAIAIANGVLHVAERTGTNTTVMRYHDNFLDDPSQVLTTVKHEDGTYVAYPQFDGGFAADNASWEDLTVDCDGLTATAHATSGAWIVPTYDPDGSGSYVDTGLSDSAGTSATTMLSGQKTLYWGTLLGKAAVTMQKKLTLKRGTTNTLTPRLHALTVGFKKRRKALYTYEFDVNRAATAALRNTTVTKVDAEIDALLPTGTIIKVTLAYGASETTPTARKVSTRVYVNEPSWADDAGDAATPIPPGAVRMFCSEG